MKTNFFSHYNMCKTYITTRMHSSRMHTSSTVPRSIWQGRGVYLLGVYLLGGVPVRGCTCLGGVPAGGISAWECTCLGALYLPGVYLNGRWVYLPRGTWLGGTCPGTPHLLTEFLTQQRETLMKLLPIRTRLWQKLIR